MGGAPLLSERSISHNTFAVSTLGPPAAMRKIGNKQLSAVYADTEDSLSGGYA
jgi:hypothetical protein